MDIKEEVIEIAKKAKEASKILAQAPSDLKNKALIKIAQLLDKNRSTILEENRKDVDFAKREGLSGAIVDRLTLNDKRIDGMIKGIKDLVGLRDPVGEVVGMWERPNGLQIGRVRVPLGVVGIIYEARPNVTSDAAGLCLKSGNAVVLRGGREAINSNRAIVSILQSAVKEVGFPEASVSFIGTVERKAVREMVKLGEFIDVIILRGGKSLIEAIGVEARVPLIAHGEGNCHTYVDKDADIEMALKICYNAKCQRPGVCNAMETLLVHKDVADVFLPRMIKMLKEGGVEVRGCERTRGIFQDIKEATEEDWATEYLGLILAIKIVDSIDEAIGHINKYGTSHSEAIITTSYPNARRFLKEVDAAAVYVNASTRFTDGGEFGLGAEIGISTQKLHARGPMGLEELTTTKFIIYGDGQIRE
jgi:glutamate-5-semialdehyde dehydrogenase